VLFYFFYSLFPDLKHIPVVILTNLAGTQDSKLALSKGAVAYMVKSEHDPKEVVDKAKELMAKGKSDNESVDEPNTKKKELGQDEQKE